MYCLYLLQTTKAHMHSTYLPSFKLKNNNMCDNIISQKFNHMLIG